MRPIRLRKRMIRTSGSRRGRTVRLAWQPGVLILFVLIGCVIWGIRSLEINLRPALAQAAQVKSRQLAIHLLHETVRSHLRQQAPQEDWLLWRYDRRGRISAMQLNPRLVASVTEDLLHWSSLGMSKLRTIRTSVPLGQALQSPLLTALGPRVPMTLEPAGTTEVQILTRMKPAGINMVMVEVYARIDADVTVLVPFQAAKAHVTTEIPLTVSMIVGDVPQVNGWNASSWPLPAPTAPTDATKDKD
jgi:sporulation protein YunB